MADEFFYQYILPDKPLIGFVENMGMFHNSSSKPKNIILIPDGRVDLFFTKTKNKPFQISIIGLETIPKENIIPPHTLVYKVSFTLLGVDSLLQTSIAQILNHSQNLPPNFLNFMENDLIDFNTFHQKMTLALTALLPAQIEERKRLLFELIYSSNGEIKVATVAEKSAWNSRQINRYFNKQFGLSLNAFCKILRFKASLQHLSKGQLFPELNFTDQAHFIKEIKKFSGVIPSELLKNKDDRFILLSVLKEL